MKVAAAVLSWIGGALTIAILWVNISPLFDIDTAWLVLPLLLTLITIAVLIYRQWATNHGSKILAGILTIIFCGLLGGIFTLCIPESDLGGYAYHPKKNSYLKTVSSTSTVSRPKTNLYPQPVRVGDRIEVINGFFMPSAGKRVNPGTISSARSIEGNQVTFITSVSGCTFSASTGMSNLRIIGRMPQPVEPPKEEPKPVEKPKEEPAKQLDKFEEIKKYKELLDLNIITQEEFDAKKKELNI